MRQISDTDVRYREVDAKYKKGCPPTCGTDSRGKSEIVATTTRSVIITRKQTFVVG